MLAHGEDFQTLHRAGTDMIFDGLGVRAGLSVFECASLSQTER